MNSGKPILIGLVLAILAAMVFLTGCSQDKGPELSPSQFDGTWVNGQGDALLLDSNSSSYILRKSNGRTGSSGYTVSEDRKSLFLFFNGFLYNVLGQDDGTIILNQNGHAADEKAESMDEYVFVRDDSVSMKDFDLSDVNGTWENENGVAVTIDVPAREYRYSCETGVGTGTLANAEDGRGWYLFCDGFAFLILKEDGSLIFETEDPLFGGSVFVKHG